MLFEIALILIDGVGPITAKNLVATFGTAEQLFKESPHQLRKLIGNDRVFHAIRNKVTVDRANEELNFAERQGIRVVSCYQDEYPQRLKHCEDAPLVLFSKGKGSPDPERVISIVGTRKISDYGREACEEIVAGLAPYKPCIVSGLALGVDTLAHKLALKCGLETTAVVAHGLDRIYPRENRELSERVRSNGLLLTEHLSGSEPDRENFPKRNRIVAGMSSATIVVETAVKGGSMITASLAMDYSRDVVAVPGRMNDHNFSGCNRLIAMNKAAIYTGVDELINILGWKERVKKPLQRSLLLDLNPDEMEIVNYLNLNKHVQIDVMSLDLSWPLSKLNSVLMAMELKGLVKASPGKMFSL